jgi:hypothetical protein
MSAESKSAARLIQARVAIAQMRSRLNQIEEIINSIEADAHPDQPTKTESEK